ncbi:hypothetical protein XELAEV_18028504mg [Xenopus laevis]|uniref:Uncharacterized protein n=1 Tax=Xenopus laevis TaxID=8355 RepID=A0A974CQI7_XENLA|nr:hypothetical protein XELAEV_18028504mg [Xenopus laevis]
MSYSPLMLYREISSLSAQYKSQPDAPCPNTHLSLVIYCDKNIKGKAELSNWIINSLLTQSRRCLCYKWRESLFSLTLSFISSIFNICCRILGVVIVGDG